MSNERALVDLFHDALDAEDVAGPFQRLQLELEKPTGAAVLRRTRRTFMTRQRIALLAAALVVLVIAGVLVGTRLNNNPLRNTSVPASTPSPHQIDQAMVNQLLARPLHFQTIKPGDPCPDSANPNNGYLGAGPAYGIVNAKADSTSWGSYWSVSIVTPYRMAGPAVARARDLTHGSPVLDIGPLGAGPVYATDVYQGKTVNQFQAVAFDTNGPTKTNFSVGGDPYVKWDYLQGFKNGSGVSCIGVQIDSPGFIEIFYAEVSG